MSKKWSDEVYAELEGIVGSESPVSQATVEKAATALTESQGTEYTVRSIASKLRKEGVEVAKKEAAASAFSEAETEVVASFVTANSGEFTYAEVASQVLDAKFGAKAIQGKVLSLELTEHIKPTPAKVVQKSFNEQEEATIVKLVGSGAYLEDIAEALGRDIKAVRGKCLSMRKSHGIDIPEQKNKKEVSDLFANVDVENSTVAELAEQTGKTERGIKTCLTNRSLVAKDWDGAAKQAKIQQRAAA